MTRPVPICPPTIGAAVDMNAGIDGSRASWVRPPTAPCLGSACAAWVPETLGDVRCRQSWPNTCSAEPTDAETTGHGRCAFNVMCPPWPDPAAEKPATETNTEKENERG